MNSRQAREEFIRLVRNIKKKSKRVNDFTGMGLVLYSSSYLSSIPRFSLRPKIRFDRKMNINEELTADFLVEISRKNNPLHDGFHFIDQNGNVTLLAQYFVPPIRKIIPHKKNSVRYHAALLGSYVKGIICTASIGSKRESFFFERGKKHRI